MKIFILLIILLISSGAYADDGIDAESLIDMVTSRYKSFDSYHDEGVIEQFKIPGKSGQPVFRKVFLTKYRADGKFKLEWHDTVEWNHPRRTVIWGNVDSANVYIEKIKEKLNTPLKSIIPIGYTTALQFNIPGILIDDIRHPFEEQDAQYSVEKTSEKDSTSSFILTKTHRRKDVGITKYWIRADNLLIYKYENTGRHYQTTIKYNTTRYDEELSDSEFTFTPPFNAEKALAEILVSASGRSVNGVIALKEICDEFIPGYTKRTSKAFRQWQQDNSIGEHNTDQDQINDLVDRIREIRNDELRKTLDQFCDSTHTLFETQNNTRHPHFSTPEKTWEHYIDSLKKANRVEAISCLSGIARNNYRKLLEKMSDKQLREMGNSITAFQITMRISDDMAEGMAGNSNKKAGSISFQKINGNWKITQM